MPRVLVTTNCPHWPFARQTPGRSGVWEDFEFVFDETDVTCDAWIVLENPLTPVRATTIAHNTFFVSIEPPEIRRFRADFLQQFRWVITCHDVAHRGLIATHSAVQWFVGVDFDRDYHPALDYDALRLMPLPPKPHLLSAAISTKTMTPGHRLRLELVRLLKQELGDDFHVWGQGHEPFADKWDVVAPYRFHLALENATLPNYITEKVCDALLGYAYPFYVGAPNLGDFLPAGSYQPIDASRPREAIRTIREAIDSNLDQQRLQEVAAARQIVLNQFNLFPHMAKILRHKMVTGPHERLQIYPKNQHAKLAWSQLRRSFRRSA